MIPWNASRYPTLRQAEPAEWGVLTAAQEPGWQPQEVDFFAWKIRQNSPARNSSNRGQVLVPVGVNWQVTLAMFTSLELSDGHLSFTRDFDAEIRPHRSFPN